MSNPGSSFPGGNPNLGDDDPSNNATDASLSSSDQAVPPSNPSDTAAALVVFPSQSDPGSPSRVSPQSSQSNIIWSNPIAGPSHHSMGVSHHSGVQPPSPDLRRLSPNPSSVSPDPRQSSPDMGPTPSLTSGMSGENSSVAFHSSERGTGDSPTQSVSTNDDQRVPSMSDYQHLPPDSASLRYTTPTPPPLPMDDILVPAIGPNPHGAMSVIGSSSCSSGAASAGTHISAGTGTSGGTITPITGLGILSLTPQQGNNPNLMVNAPLPIPSAGARRPSRTRRPPATSAEDAMETETTRRRRCTRCRDRIDLVFASQYPQSALCQQCFGTREATASLGSLIQSSTDAEEAARNAEDFANQPVDQARETIDRVLRWVASTSGVAVDHPGPRPLSAGEQLSERNWGGTSRNIENVDIADLPNRGRFNDSDDSDDGVDVQFRTMDTVPEAEASVSGLATEASVSGLATEASVSGLATGASVSGLATGASVSGLATGASVSVLATGASVSGLDAGASRATVSGGIGFDTTASLSNLSSTDANVVMGGVAAHAPQHSARPTNFPTGLATVTATPADALRAILSNRRSSLGSGGSGGSGTLAGAGGSSDSGVATGGSGTPGGTDSGASGSNSPARGPSPRELRSRMSPYHTSRRRSSRDHPSSPGGGTGGKIKKQGGARMALVTYDITDDAFAAMFPKTRAINFRNLLKNGSFLEGFKITNFKIPENFNQSSTNIIAEPNSLLREALSKSRRILNISKDSLGDSFECSDEEDSF